MTKSYKCRVEYLESTGTQWIDTGFVPTSDNFKFEIRMLSQNTSAYIGYRSVNSGTATGDMRWFFNYSDGRVAIRYGNTTENSTLSFNTQTTHKFYFNGSSLYVDDVNYLTTTKKYATPVYKSFYLFSVNTSGYYSTDIANFVGRIYYTKIWNNDVLVRDLIPVLDNAGRPAMYDQVSGQLFYNQGTGEFTYGRQIIPVEYLYTGDDINCGSSSPFTSTSYRLIDTKETIDLTSVVEIKFAFDKNIYYSGCGLRNNSSNMTQSIYFPACYATQDKFGWTIGSGEEQRQKFTLDTNDHTIRVDLPNSKVVWDDVNYPIANLTYTPSERTFPLFAFSDVRATQENGYRFPMQGKIYYAKFWKNGVLTKDFIPCIDENLVPFMFDKVHNTVYLNAGTGQFKVGPNVEKAWGGKKLRRKLALALANLKKKRKYYCEVEYLEGTGTQYINLNYIPTDTTGYKMGQVIPTSNSRDNIIIGCRQATNSDSRFWQDIDWSSANKTIGWGFGGYSPSGQRYSIVDKVGTYIVTSLNYMNDRAGKVDGVSYDTSLESKTLPEISRPMYLFAGNNGGTDGYYTSTKIYFVQITEGNKIVHDLIPVLDWNMTPCMFDRVTEQLFYNAGSGNFTVGREIHYVDYLESTGVEYVDTGIKFDGANTKIELKTYEDSLTRRHSICGDDGNFFYYFRGTGNWAVGYNGTAANIDLYMSVGDNVFVMDKNNVYVNGVLAKTYTASSSVSSYKALLFNRKTSLVDNGAVTMYYCKIWNNNVLVRDYIPAIDENGVGYMFDRVSHTCFLNQGTGAFKYPAREVEYLTSDGNQYIDTGIQPTDDYGYKIRNTYTRGGGEQCAIGCMDNGNRFVGIYTSGSENQLSGAWGSFVGFLPTFAWATGDILDVEVNYKNSRKMIVNGTELKDISDIHVSGTVSNTIYLFARHYGSTITKMKGNVYGVEITNGQNVVADFIPSIKDGVLGMWDKANGVFYPNAGTGTFTTGKIVEPEYE